MLINKKLPFLIFFFILFGSLCISGCGSSGGGGSDDNEPLQPPITDLSGIWQADCIEHSGTDDIDAYSERFTIVQNGNQISFSSDYYGGENSGTISGNRITLSGVLTEYEGESRFTFNATVDQENINHITGRMDWTYTEPGYTGSGYTEIDAWKVTDSGDRESGGQDGVLPEDDFYETEEDSLLTVSYYEGLLVNDDTGNSNGISVVSTGELATENGGMVLLAHDGSFTYEPPVNFFGTDRFIYTIETENGEQGQGMVYITVTPVNDPPMAVDDDLEITINEPVIIYVLSNDTDPDNDTMTVVEVGQPYMGSVTLNQDGTITYYPPDDFNGEDTFYYRVADSTGEQATGWVRLTIAN